MMSVSDRAYMALLRRLGFQVIIEKDNIRLVVVHTEKEEIIRWIE
jgi:hypothetical protein